MVDELVKWAQILQGFGILFAIWFGVLQWRQQNELTKASNSQSLASQAADFNLALVGSDSNLKAWYTFGKMDGNTPYELERYRELLIQWLLLHENVFLQNTKRLLDPEVYASWNRDLAYTIQTHNLSVIARSIEDVFPGAYGAHIRSLQKQTSAAGGVV